MSRLGIRAHELCGVQVTSVRFLESTLTELMTRSGFRPICSPLVLQISYGSPGSGRRCGHLILTNPTSSVGYCQVQASRQWNWNWNCPRLPYQDSSADDEWTTTLCKTTCFVNFRLQGRTVYPFARRRTMSERHCSDCIHSAHALSGVAATGSRRIRQPAMSRDESTKDVTHSVGSK